jgi:L-threonylcarbamoyladenylate synthase
MHTTDIARGVVSQDDHSIAFRISSHAFVHAVTTELGAPIVSTSANISGLPAPYESQDVLDMFAGAAYQPDAFFDVGALPHKSPSTIARVHAGEIEIIRQGELVIDR